jgi:hypothetical protein
LGELVPPASRKIYLLIDFLSELDAHSVLQYIVISELYCLYECSGLPYVTSGKSRFFLMRLSYAYHGLMMILSILKQKVSKLDCASAKPGPPMNLAYQRLIVWLTLDLG